MARRLRWRSAGAIAVAVPALLSGCGDRLRPPPPEATDDTLALPALPESELDVPIRVALGPLVEEVEAVIPSRWGGLERRLPVPGNDRVHVAVELRRGELDGSVVGSTATLSSTLWYRVRAWYDPPLLPEISASCAPEPMAERPRVRVTLEAPITVDREWRLSAKTRRVRVHPLTSTDRDRCQISFLNIDITDRVTDAATSLFQRHRTTLDSLVASADIRSSFESWWALVGQPIRLGDGVWLLLDPRAVARGPIAGEGDAVEIPVRLVARPRVVLGARPDPAAVPLPPLDSAAAVGRGLNVLVEGQARYDSIAARLTREVGPVTFEHSGRSVRAELAGLRGIGGGRVALEVRVRGDVRAVLYLVGTPTYDGGTGLVSVPDLELDVATRNVLLRGPAWLADARVERWLRERAVWPAAPAVEWVADEIDRKLEITLAEGVVLRGSLDELSILDVAAGRDALYVRALLRGEAVLDVGEGA